MSTSAGDHDARPHSRFRRALLIIGVAVVALIAIVLLLALIPVSRGDVASHPRPTSTYDEAVARFRTVTADEGVGVLPACRSRLLDHGRRTAVSVVLIHGWTNCPRQFAELGEQAYEAGANVLILRAPLHGLADASGTRIGDVGKVGALSPSQLTSYADASVDIGVGLGESTRVLGLSMGGVLSGWIAQNRGDVDRAVLVAPALRLHGLPPIVGYGFGNLFSRLPDVAWGGSDAFRLDHAYAGVSTHSLASVFVVGEVVRDEASVAPPAVRTIVVDTNAADQQVDNGAAADLVADWRAHGADVETYEFPASDGLTHDVIDVQQQVAKPDLVYPILLRQLGLAS